MLWIWCRIELGWDDINVLKIKESSDMRNEILWQHNIEQKVYRQRRIKRRRRKKNRPSELFFSENLQSFFSCQLRLLKRFGFISQDFKTNIVNVPKNFSFKNDYDGCLAFFRTLLSSYVFHNGNLIISFVKCQQSTIACFSLLEVLLLELDLIKDKYNQCRYQTCKKEVKFIQSVKDSKTNKYLHAFFGIKLPEEQNDGSKYLKMIVQTGKKRKYFENTKAKVSGNVTKFVNDSAQEVSAQLKLAGIRALGGMLGEVLGNAEDHCAEYSCWYVDGISFSEKQHGVDVVDLNIAIINFGQSMYEGFESTKNENLENYSKCDKLYSIHKLLFSRNNHFEKESLFTMYMLNEGISRLKYKDESRGNGTMKFLESFITLGSFGNIDSRFKCQLNIISGHTTLTCDNDIGIYKDNGKSKISLNKEHDLKMLPYKDYLSYHTEYFPGTILECHIYLNKNYFYKILKEQ